MTHYQRDVYAARRVRERDTRRNDGTPVTVYVTDDGHISGPVPDVGEARADAENRYLFYATLLIVVAIAVVSRM